MKFFLQHFVLMRRLGLHLRVYSQSVLYVCSMHVVVGTVQSKGCLP